MNGNKIFNLIVWEMYYNLLFLWEMTGNINIDHFLVSAYSFFLFFFQPILLLDYNSIALKGEADYFVKMLWRFMAGSQYDSSLIVCRYIRLRDTVNREMLPTTRKW